MLSYKVKVYVKTNSNHVVTDINSSQFIRDITGYTQIDEGNGDRYTHAQGNYLEKGLMTNGKYNYKLIDKSLVELTDEEKAALFPTPPKVQSESDLINNLILDNLNMQMQIDTLIQSNL